MSNVLQVFSPSLQRVHESGRSRRSASSTAVVRARRAIEWSRLWVIVGLNFYEFLSCPKDLIAPNPQS